MGEEPDWEKCPPDWDDFPSLVISSVNIFHSMGDRIYPDIGYIGKDYTNFNFLLKLYKIEKWQEDFVMEVMILLDNRTIKASQQKLKAEHDRIKRSSGRR